MKKIAIYILSLCALLTSCSKDGLQASQEFVEGGGSVKFAFQTETLSSEYNPISYCTIRIYSSEGLIRKYLSIEEMPETLNLLAGNYSIDVELGDMQKASFTNRSYHGVEDFVVEAGKQTSVDVLCNTLHAAVEVVYDSSMSALESGYMTKVSATEASLEYTESATGYFLCPEQQTMELSWEFVGVHSEKGAVEKSDKLVVKAGGKYTLKFAYSPDAVGLLDFTIEVVEPTPENGGDVIIFSPEPVFSGYDFELDDAQVLYGEPKQINIVGPNPLSGLTLEIDGQSYDVVNNTVEGISLTQSDNKNWSLFVDDSFFSSYVGGNHTIKMVATDTEGGEGSANVTFVTQGIVPTDSSSCDLWLNSASVKVNVYDESVTDVKVMIRKSGGEWQTVTATKSDATTYTAVVGPEWVTETNSKGLEVYKPKAGTGIFANSTYQTKAVIGGVEKSAIAEFTTSVSQPIPYSGFEDSSLSCWGDGNSNAPYWGSGNNWAASNLCKQGTCSGMGGSYCAVLRSSETLGNLASGNLFTGTFVMSGMMGTVSFGIDYNWVARPRAIRVKYHATVGTVDVAKYSDSSGSTPLSKGDQDMSRIYALIVDWSSRPQVVSGTSAPSGCFDPSAIKSISGSGPIIACASLLISSSTSGSSMQTVEIPFEFYDKVAKPSSQYKLVISAACSTYGDYMCGSSSNVLYLDDFEWVY